MDTMPSQILLDKLNLKHQSILSRNSKSESPVLPGSYRSWKFLTFGKSNPTQGIQAEHTTFV